MKIIKKIKNSLVQKLQISKVFFYKKMNKDLLYGLELKGTVLDLGAGNSPYRELILNTADNYISIDWESSLHKKNPPDFIADLNIDRLPFEEQSMDHVVSIEVLEHLHNPQNALNEAHRILKNEGSFVLTVPFMWWVHEEPYDYFRYTKWGLIHLLKQAGFSQVEVKAKTGFWLMWFLKLNYYIVGITISRTYLVLVFFVPVFVFTLGTQILGKLLDRIILNQEKETAGYYVRAWK